MEPKMQKILAIAFVIAVVATAVITMRSTRIRPPVVAHQIATGSVGDVNLPPPVKTNPIVSNILQQPNRSLPPSQIPRLSLSEEQKTDRSLSPNQTPFGAPWNYSS